MTEKVKKEKKKVERVKIKSINGIDWNIHNEIYTFDWLEKEAKRIVEESENFVSNGLAHSELSVELRNLNDSYNRLVRLGMKEDELSKFRDRYFKISSNLKSPMDFHTDYRCIYMANIQKLKDCINRHYRLLDRIDEQMNIVLNGDKSYVESTDITPPSVLNKTTMENINHCLNNGGDVILYIDSLLKNAETKTKWKNFR